MRSGSALSYRRIKPLCETTLRQLDRPTQELSMRFPVALVIIMLTGWAAPAWSSDEAWQGLQQGGTVALFRHARAPGTGDPANFRLDDCSTQRNLSEEGQRQSQRIGEQFRTRKVPVERVLSSRW